MFVVLYLKHMNSWDPHFQKLVSNDWTSYTWHVCLTSQDSWILMKSKCLWKRLKRSIVRSMFGKLPEYGFKRLTYFYEKPLLDWWRWSDQSGFYRQSWPPRCCSAWCPRSSARCPTHRRSKHRPGPHRLDPGPCAQPSPEKGPVA